MPLTYSERSRLTAYGTQSARLTTDSQLKFGDCCLSLSPASDPVATPSGHIYSREAIVAYLLTKNKELKDARAKYEAQLAADEQKQKSEELARKEDEIHKFMEKDQGPAQRSTEEHGRAHQNNLKRKIDTETVQDGKKKLKQISYWLSEAQPQYTNESKEESVRNNPPPKRPPSPMSGDPLRLKDLIPIKLQREAKGNGGSEVGKCICAVSAKAITTQPVVAIKKSGIVILKEVYDKVVKTSKGMTCPITGTKIKEKDVIELKKGASGYAASGEVVASKYTPTMT